LPNGHLPASLPQGQIWHRRGNGHREEAVNLMFRHALRAVLMAVNYKVSSAHPDIRRHAPQGLPKRSLLHGVNGPFRFLQRRNTAGKRNAISLRKSRKYPYIRYLHAKKASFVERNLHKKKK